MTLNYLNNVSVSVLHNVLDRIYNNYDREYVKKAYLDNDPTLLDGHLHSYVFDLLTSECFLESKREGLNHG